MSKDIPGFSEGRRFLPRPIFDERPDYVEVYWKAWEFAFRNFHRPAPSSGFVSDFIDAAFNEYIFLWDTCFLTMFCKYGHPHLPGIGSLDNFYVKQHPSGEICREIHRTEGTDHPLWINRERKPLWSRLNKREARVVSSEIPDLTLDALNHPIFTWAELEHYRHTGDRERLVRVYPVLRRYYEALRKILLHPLGLYVTDWASMDNSPRNDRLGCGVDISCEMVLFARNLAVLARLTGEASVAATLEEQAAQLTARINELMWDEAGGFFFDVDDRGERIGVRTVAAYWALLAGVATPKQAARLVAELLNPATFDRRHRVPTLAANERDYDPKGGYWRGAVWAPTNMMVQRGLECCGSADLAAEIALGHLDAVARVYAKTGTIWENYAPDDLSQGTPAKSDFVGWSGLGPILNLIEYGIGLRPDAPANTLIWRLTSPSRTGCENFTFGSGHNCDLLAEPCESSQRPRRITVSVRHPLRLVVSREVGDPRRIPPDLQAQAGPRSPESLFVSNNPAAVARGGRPCPSYDLPPGRHVIILASLEGAAAAGG